MFNYITREDFACKCGCGFDTFDFETRAVLQEAERWFGKPVHMNSGCRCEEHNRDEGGVPNSQHLLGRAADFYIEGIDASMVYDYLDKLYPDRFGVGKYTTFTHVDTRANRARW